MARLNVNNAFVTLSSFDFFENDTDKVLSVLL